MKKLSKALVVVIHLILGSPLACSPLALAKENEMKKSTFPKGFVFGTASSAYQYEGAAREAGKGPSIWDSFTHLHPDRIVNGSNGDIAIDSYHRYKEDVAIMKDMGMNAYRFSISWPRILPTGSLSGGINKEGIKYYNNLINELISNGMQPFVTLFHWDSPQVLQDLYGGFSSSRIVNDFADYADICFREFGDRVKHWITFNEPWSFSVIGIVSSDSGREPYILAHNQLLAHAEAVNLFRTKYQESQKGIIGITLVSNWMIPYSNSQADKDSATRALEFMFGWFMDPITKGNYPPIMRKLVGNRLPKFTPKQSKILKGSFDFIGVNYYTARYTRNVRFFNSVNKSYDTDSLCNQTTARNGIDIGPMAASNWLYIYPRGIRDLLVYTKNTYNNPVIYITENGVDELNNEKLSLEQALKDDFRIDFYRQHLSYVHTAIQEGVDVRGYFAWSLLDNFEWTSGFSVRFGINYVDYKDGLKRYPKSSSLWFRQLLKG